MAASPRKMSGLDAAVLVLREAGRPMNCKEVMEAMLAKGLWQTGGKTPATTFASAIIRETAAKGEKARFKEVDRGVFKWPSSAAPHRLISKAVWKCHPTRLASWHPSTGNGKRRTGILLANLHYFCFDSSRRNSNEKC
jgi:hypothetical protein